MKRILTFILCITATAAQTLNYPYPVNFLSLNIEQQQVKMAYMDVPSSKPNGKVILCCMEKTSMVITGKT